MLGSAESGRGYASREHATCMTTIPQRHRRTTCLGNTALRDAARGNNMSINIYKTGVKSLVVND